MTACPAGKYCEDYALTAPTGDCLEGYYCQAGSKTKAPKSLAVDKGDRCPIASYCVAGTSVPTLCPIGTFTNGIGLFSDQDCNPCPPGFICDVQGTTDATVKTCPAGSYCEKGTSSSGNAIPCPEGYYCPAGSAVPTPCPSGFYSAAPGATTCTKCLAGVYCPYQTVNGLVPGTGYVVNSDQMPGPAACPPGTYKSAASNT